VALWYEDWDLVPLLVEHTLNVNAPTPTGKRAALAAAHPNVQTISLLLARRKRCRKGQERAYALDVYRSDAEEGR